MLLEHRSADHAVGDAVELGAADAARIPVRVLPGPPCSRPAATADSLARQQHPLQRRAEPRQSAPVRHRSCRSSRSPAGRSASTACSSTAAAAACRIRRAFSLHGFLQAERPVANPGQPTGLLRQPLHLSRQDAVRGVLPVRRRGQLRRRQLPARQCGALGRHRFSEDLAPLRSHVRSIRSGRTSGTCTTSFWTA